MLARLQALPGQERAPEALELRGLLGAHGDWVALRDNWWRRTIEARAVSAAMSADGRRVLSAGDEIRLWNAKTGDPWLPWPFKGHEGPALSVALSGDGRLALSGGKDRTLRLWDAFWGGCIRVFKGVTGEVVVPPGGWPHPVTMPPKPRTRPSRACGRHCRRLPKRRSKPRRI